MEKTCKDCKEVKGIDCFAWVSHKRNLRQPRCKPCHILRNGAYQKAYSAMYHKKNYRPSGRSLNKKQQEIAGEKVCITCNILKPLSLYSLSTTRYKGVKKISLRNQCTECINKHVREYLKDKRPTIEFKARYKIYSAKYRKSSGCAASKRWKNNNREKLRICTNKRDAERRLYLLDTYVKQSLYATFKKTNDCKGLDIKFSDFTPEIIDAQRKNLILKRKIKAYEKDKNKD